MQCSAPSSYEAPRSATRETAPTRMDGFGAQGCTPPKCSSCSRTKDSIIIQSNYCAHFNLARLWNNHSNSGIVSTPDQSLPAENSSSTMRQILLQPVQCTRQSGLQKRLRAPDAAHGLSNHGLGALNYELQVKHSWYHKFFEVRWVDGSTACKRFILNGSAR
jgi:hypothetical protein